MTSAHAAAISRSTLVIAALAAALAGCQRVATEPAALDSAVDAQGHIHVPANYRTQFVTLGTFAVAADTGPGSKELHVVYTQPDTIAAYKQTGHYPDGAVLVKEVYATVTAPQTTGTVSHADKLKGWFVMVRDSKNTHAGNALWGDGWGWSWFNAADTEHTTSTDYHTDCLTCHEPARSTEFSYVMGYPVLRK